MNTNFASKNSQDYNSVQTNNAMLINNYEDISSLLPLNHISKRLFSPAKCRYEKESFALPSNIHSNRFLCEKQTQSYPQSLKVFKDPEFKNTPHTVYGACFSNKATSSKGREINNFSLAISKNEPMNQYSMINFQPSKMRVSKFDTHIFALRLAKACKFDFCNMKSFIFESKMRKHHEIIKNANILNIVSKQFWSQNLRIFNKVRFIPTRL